jgi:hypothetical protein
VGLYTRQLAEQIGGSDKGPSFVPENFQYMQAAVGPVGNFFNFLKKIVQLFCFLFFN